MCGERVVFDNIDDNNNVRVESAGASHALRESRDATVQECWANANWFGIGNDDKQFGGVSQLNACGGDSDGDDDKAIFF